ncbi:MAG: RNA polymerase factor sigma-54 [Proteobacteria bacterium]|nr:RNA polymerase factor sigma-54 [Pseudomonadota bacterium]
MKLNLNQRLELNVSGQIVQLMKLLQVNRTDLEQLIETELEQNPILEKSEEEETEIEELPVEKKDENLEKFLKEFEWIQEEDFKYKYYAPKKIDEAISPDIYPEEKDVLETFKMDYSSKLRGKELDIGKTLVDLLDGNGFLRISADEISKRYNFPPDKVRSVIETMKRIAPEGVGSRDMFEFIAFQLNKKGFDGYKYAGILRKYGKEFKAGAIDKISELSRIPTSEIEDILEAVKSCRPVPIMNMKQDNNYITPDVIIRKINGRYEIIINEDELPTIRINDYYLSLLKGEKGDLSDEEKKDLKKHLYGAKSFIANLYRRRETIERIAHEILIRQYRFFEEGIESLKPLYMKEIAESLGLSNSTVTRALANKYFDTPHGIFPSKFFFLSRVKARGENISVSHVLNRIKQIVDAEDKRTPLSDLRITEILNKEGIDIKRRTVAKYRETLGIPKKGLRKRFNV